jgi:general secretion pathway protein N
MKNKLVMVVIFIITFIGFLIATLPTSFVLKQVTLPRSFTKSVYLSGVSGSIWHTNISQVVINGTPIDKVDARLHFWSLMTLTPKLSITFGDSFNAGPEGALDLVLSSDTAKISDVTVLISANEIAQQLPLPLPMTAQGEVELNISSAEIDLSRSNQCVSATGNGAWSTAGITALSRNVPLGKLSADISCDKGTLALVMSPKNDLGLTFTAYVKQGGKISGKGYLQPGATFPAALNDALPFLGTPDGQGRYRLVF